MTNFIEHVNRQNDLVKQVMRQDIQRRTFKRYLEQFKTDNMLFLVLHTNDYLARDKNSNRIKKSLKKYFRSVDNQVFSKKSNKRLQRYVVIENLKNNRRNHIQIAIECPKHLNKFEMQKILKNCLNNEICNLEHIAEVYNFTNLTDYNTKDMDSVRPYQTDKTFDEVNSHRVQ
tara:strand:- start:268 stop:786 length:519 start_codon:yes stop_codon:yes gene_type:complete